MQDGYPGYGGDQLPGNTLIVFPSLLPHKGLAEKDATFFQFNVYLKQDILPYKRLEKDHTLNPTSLAATLAGDLFDLSGN